MGSRTVVRRLLSRLRRNRLDDDLAEEIRQHLDLRRRSLIDAGMDPREAEYEARRQFGNVFYIRERARDSWSFPSLSSLASDIRFALRMMSRAPGHTAAVVLTIALGAGLNGAVFVIFNAVLLGTPRVPEPHGVVRLDDGRPTLGPTYPDYVDYRDRTANAVNLAAYSSTNVSVRPDLLSAGAPERAAATLASGNYFAVMGARAIHGRTFDGRDDLPPTGRPVVVLGETYWTRRFNRDPTVVGRTIELNSQPFTIVGVLPADFRDVDVPGMSSPFVRELWVPLWTLPVLDPGDTRLVERTAWWGLQSIGRLERGVPVEQARAQILAVAAGLDREYAGQRRERAPWVSRVTDIDRRLLVGEAGLIAGAAGMATLLVLLVGCANVANLVLARTSARSREIAVRLSLGAGRGRILRQFLTESLFLSLLGTGLGVAIASGGLRALTRASGAQPLAWSLAPDFRVVIYALTLSALVALVTGVVPALQASRPAVLPALKAGAGPHHLGRWRAVFVAAEIAICLVFLVTTALLLRAAQHAKAIDPIIPVHHLLAVSAEGSRLHGYAGPRLAGLLREMQARAEALPGIAATAVVNPVPFSGNRHGTTVRPFEAADAPGTRVFLSNVSPGFFEVVNLRIVRGGGFSGAPDEVVVNQALALRLFNGSDPLGRRITSGDFDKRQHTVVGVVQDAPFVSLRSRDDPFMFRPIDLEGGGSVVVRTSGPATGLARPLAEALQRVDQRFDIDVNPIARGIEDEIAAVGNGVTVVAGLSSLALLLALFGVAAVTVHSVVQRTHEIGVRMALGAQPVDAIRLVVRQSLRPVLAGAAIGLMGAGALGRLLPVESLYGLSRLDPIAFGAAGFFLVATSIAAAWLPARRVAKIDPLLSLRAD